MEEERRGSWWTSRRVAALLVALLIVVVVLISAVRPYLMPAASMAPAVGAGDRFLANRWAYDLTLPFSERSLLSWDEPEVGELVIAKRPGDERLLLKRIVAGPGQTLEMRDHRLIIDGRPVRYESVDPTIYESDSSRNRTGTTFTREFLGDGEAYVITFVPLKGRGSFGPLTLASNHYFLMGDNRDVSTDSRHWGTVPRERILGRLLTVYLRGSGD
jgi:signal peptidase I